MNENINMIVSPVCSKNGEKFAYVSFTDGKCTADGRIPECKITSNKGFEQKDIEVLELYMKSNLAKTRERKLKALEAAEELKCENLLLITWGTDDMAEYKGHTIKIVSVRNWFYACKLPYILNIPVVTSQKATDTPHPDRWLFIPCSDSVSSARHRTPHCRSRWQS